MQLREWQQRFQNTVLGITPLAELPLHEAGISPAESMNIYANAYRERLRGALQDNYRALHQVLGDSDFAEMAYAFISVHPPQTASIRWFGADLADYLSATAPYIHCLALSEIARFEWALRHTVDAADAARIDANYLQTLSVEQWEAFTCDLHPSLTILQFVWNAPQIWRAIDAEEETPEPTHFDSYWFVYRDSELTTQWRSADAYEAQALQLWTHGENFGAICEFLAQKSGNEESAIGIAAAFMRTWVEQGLLIHSQQGGKQYAYNH